MKRVDLQCYDICFNLVVTFQLHRYPFRFHNTYQYRWAMNRVSSGVLVLQNRGAAAFIGSGPTSHRQTRVDYNVDDSGWRHWHKYQLTDVSPHHMVQGCIGK
jgi:hypothetical protein